MKSICIFAHFNKNNNLEDYVIDYLNTIKELVDEVIFVSTSEIDKEKKILLSNIVSEIIIKENQGYDFGSWKEGLLFVKNNYINLPNEIILCNDSCYIAKNSLKQAISSMRYNKKLDFWGITRNYSFGLHIQSYFISLNSRPINDKKFWDLVDSWEHENRKLNYILKYEIGLSKFLINQKYKMGSYIKLSFTRLSILSLKYKIIFINQYLRNAIKYLLAKILINNKNNENNKNLEKIEKLKPNLFLKKRDFQDIIKVFNIFLLQPFNANLLYLDFKDAMKIDSPFLKVSKVKDIIEKEGFNNLKRLCIKKGFNYKHIFEHQNNIYKF